MLETFVSLCIHEYVCTCQEYMKVYMCEPKYVYGYMHTHVYAVSYTHICTCWKYMWAFMCINVSVHMHI